MSWTWSSSARPGSWVGWWPTTWPSTRRTVCGSAWAVARAERLEQVRVGLGERARSWPLIVADSADPEALAELAARTRVVATTVGPYLRYGLPLAKACAAAGTHYADLTGEVLFVRASADACDEAARASGARIVHSCGFDSIPSDLGVMLLHQAVTADGAGELGDTTLVAVMKGGFSGGTIDSMRAQVEAVQAEKSLRRMVVDPYALSPDRDGEPDLGDERDRVSVFSNDAAGRLAGAVRDGLVQHPDRPAQQRAAEVGVRPHVPLPRAGRVRARHARPGRRPAR